jgi:predicted dehydrogenase
MTGVPSALPAPRTPDPHAAPPLRWGIIGTGWIAERFVGALQRNTAQRAVAVGSRDSARSAAFASTFGIDTACGSYEELVNDRSVDVVYVATPHNAHFPCAALALQAGKHVLVEKPLALNVPQCERLAELARAAGVFCMEALWTLFLPKFDVIRRLLADGVLGEIRSVQADHGEHFQPGHRILRADLAGGPLLDLGTYPVSFATWVLGAPARVLATGQPHPAGVNGQASMILTDAADNQAVLHTTLFSITPTTGMIAGTTATLTIDGPFYQPGPMTLTDVRGRALIWDEPRIAHEALHFEAAEVARCIAAGALESPLRPLADSIATIAVLDEVRRQIGVVFAEER